MNAWKWTALALAAAAAMPAQADLAVAEPKSDGDNYRSDVVSFGVELAVKTVRLGGSEAPGDGCVPAATRLIGLGSVSVPTPDGKGTEERALFQVAETRAASTTCPTPVPAGTAVALTRSALSSLRTRSGWSFGTLTVPYKYQLRGDRSLSGGATLGGYVGRRTELGGLSTQFVAFAGLTKVDVPNEAKTGTDQLAGLSYGVGVLWKLKNAFQAGLVLGADRVARSAGYANNGKPWISVSLGYDFFN